MNHQAQIDRIGPQNNETTMLTTIPNSPGTNAKQKAWKVKHSGVLVMLTRGFRANGKLSHELVQSAMVKFNYKSPKSIRRLWNKYKDPIIKGEGFKLERNGVSGRKIKFPPDELQIKIRAVPLKQRKTIRSLSFATGIPRSTLLRYLQHGLLKRTTSSIKPKLTPANVQRRIDHCKSKVEEDGLFSDLMTEVHLDEKWFFVSQVDERFYLLPDEETPYRSCKHKSHIEKIMFGAAVARPRQNPETGEWWDGKIHLHPFIYWDVAQRNSRNRPRGTLIVKSRSVDKVVYRDWLCNYVVHAVVAQWPSWAPKIVDLQQDNATPHIKPDDPAFMAVVAFYALVENGGWTIRLHFQPPNSPDFNILDLAMFRAMQSLQQMHQCKNIEELIDVVKKCWSDFPLDTLKKVWTSLQLVLDASLKAGGVNDYKLPHMSKDKYIREHGEIPLRLPCTALAPAADPTAPAPPQANETPAPVAALAQELTTLSLQAVAEADIDWEDITDDLAWGDEIGHGGDGDEDVEMDGGDGDEDVEMEIDEADA